MKMKVKKNNDFDVAVTIFHGFMLFVFRWCVYHQHMSWHYKQAKLLKKWDSFVQRSKSVMQ